MRRNKKNINCSLAEKIQAVIKFETGNDPLILRHYRGGERVEARQIFIVMMVKYTKLTYREIAGMLGKDHATVNHCLNQVQNLLDTDKQFKIMYDRIESKIKNES
jgi:chromosomal replication initiation ATPase DnaA